MGDRYLINGSIVSPKLKTHPLWQDIQAWFDAGNEPAPEHSDAELSEQEKQAQIDSILSVFEAAISKPVECIVNGKTYYMDGQQKDAETMKHGIELAELTGATAMDIVDYYNRIHEAVPLDECREIMLQQAVFYYEQWARKSKDRSAVLSA